MLIPVQYHNKRYPTHINPRIDEIAGHFDISKIEPQRKFSLHTEYSYGKRKFNSAFSKRFHTIYSANKNSVPMLWFNAEWALEFACFIKELCADKIPTVIEIHPPFTDYANTITYFLNVYTLFETSILTKLPETNLLIENRSGSVYRGGNFLISKGEHLLDLCEAVTRLNLSLKIALDIPQLLTTYGGPQNLNPEKIGFILNRLNPIQSKVKGIHLWGKRRSINGRFVSHAGNLNTYFDGNTDKKEILLTWLRDFLSDEIARYFVPEVNSTEADLHSIINDLEKMEIKFG